MTLDGKHLRGLPVETQSGTYLGRVQNFLIDPTTQTIIQYEVASTLQELLGRELLVHATQVLSLTEEKMVVEDLVLTEKVAAHSASVAS